MGKLTGHLARDTEVENMLEAVSKTSVYSIKLHR